jgi:hypothetical protein
VITLDMGLLVAGTKYRGEFEERLKKLMDEIKQNDDIILVSQQPPAGVGGPSGGLGWQLERGRLAQHLSSQVQQSLSAAATRGGEGLLWVQQRKLSSRYIFFWRGGGCVSSAHPTCAPNNAAFPAACVSLP